MSPTLLVVLYTSLAAAKCPRDSRTGNEVQGEAKKRQVISQNQEDVAPEKRDGQEEEEEDHHKQTVNVRLHFVLGVTLIRSAVLATGRLPTLPKYVVPCKIQRE